MNWLFTNLFAAFLLPPLNFLLLGVAGLMLLKRRPRLGRGLIAAMLALLWIFSMPAVGGRLLAYLERDANTPPDRLRDAQLIVVLGGGTYFNAPEYGGDTVSALALERLRLAATLHRRTGLPLLVTGGNPDGGKFPEGVLMKRALEESFGVPVRWVEAASDNTWQNAFNSRKLLPSTEVKTVVLVTHAWHMPRARRVFERAGFRVLPAGTGFHAGGKPTVLDFLPSATGLKNSSLFLHEAIGLLAYELKG
ncbi:MAG: YdcF family protein [Pseudomonadota bacterium]|jgi:uncharacterized SAM-binding protein YcdF (DUF218 family)